MNRRTLRAPILDQGIRHTNFFNGRLLFAEDLWNEAEANRAQHRQLARGIGDGVVHGLDVWIQASGAQGTMPVLKVTSGLALNRRGQALELPRDIELALVREEEQATSDAGLFANCLPPAGVTVSTPPGAYVLVMSPVSRFSAEQAPMSGLSAEGGISGCGSRYAVEGVQFRLEALPSLPPELDDLTTAAPATLRDRLAHYCLGSHKMLAPASPVDGENPQGALDDLRANNTLSDCDVPLALIRWTGTGLDFADVWPVRRFPYQGDPWLSPSRMRIFAAVKQFQTELVAVSVSPLVDARSRFFVLPPIGRIPLRDAALGSVNGFDPRTFFGQRFRELPRYIRRAELIGVLRTALDYPPRPLDSINDVRLLLVTEQVQAVKGGTATQLHAYFAPAEVDRRFCIPVVVFNSGAQPLVLDDFVITFDDALRIYREFRSIVLLSVLTPTTPLTRQDAAGLFAVEDVLREVGDLLAAATEGCLDNQGLWIAFRRAASAQQRFANTWLDVVLPQDGGNRYRPAITQLMQRIKSIVESTSFEGARGMNTALNAQDLSGARVGQEKINQSFATRIGTGPQGAIDLRYMVPPAIVPQSPPTPGRLVPGVYVFGFALNASVDREATFRLSASIAATGWSAQLWDDTQDVARPTDTITLPASSSTPGGLSQAFRVRVTVPNVADGSQVTLALRADEISGGGGVQPALLDLTITKGAEPPAPDNRVIISLVGFGGTQVGTAFQIPRATPTSAQFNVRFTVAGTYRFDLRNASGPSWTTLTTVPTSFPVGGTAGTTVPTANTTVVGVLRPGPNAQNTDVIFRVRSDSTQITPPIVEEFRIPVLIV